jgi:hypothetical protein
MPFIPAYKVQNGLYHAFYSVFNTHLYFYVEREQVGLLFYRIFRPVQKNLIGKVPNKVKKKHFCIRRYVVWVGDAIGLILYLMRGINEV